MSDLNDVPDLIRAALVPLREIQTIWAAADPADPRFTPRAPVQIQAIIAGVESWLIPAERPEGVTVTEEPRVP